MSLPYQSDTGTIDIRDIKPRSRNKAHGWFEKEILRFFKKYFNKKDYRNLLCVYLALCLIDSDFCEARENNINGKETENEKDLHGVTKTCVSYCGKDESTVRKYMQMLRNLSLIDYGRKKDKNNRVTGSYLILYEFIQIEDFYINIAQNANIPLNTNLNTKRDHSPKIGTMGGHTPKKPRMGKTGCIKNTSRLNKNEPSGSEMFAPQTSMRSQCERIGGGGSQSFDQDKPVEKDKPVDKKSPFANKRANGKFSDNKTLHLKIRKRSNRSNRNNGNGLLYNSLAKKDKEVSLDKWNHHSLDKSSKHLVPIISLQDKINNRRINRPLASEIEEVMDYWNETASQLSNNGRKLPTHNVIKNTKTSYMCKLIITGILHTSGFTVDDIKKAIDNYVWVLENSPWYGKNLYSFPMFYGNQNLFTDCIEDNVIGNPRYVRYKPEPKQLTVDDLEEEIRKFHWKRHREEMDYESWVKYYKPMIDRGEIKSKDDFYKFY